MVTAEWTGKFPTLCNGKWILIVNGNDVSDKISNTLRSSSYNNLINGMNMYGSYRMYENTFGDHSNYIEGLMKDEWIEENAYWLDTITTDYNTQVEIYEAINEKDWRSCSCGGCI